MRTLTCLFILLLGLNHETVSAQADFSGVYVSVYVGEPETVILPNSYPFTAEAERAFNDFNPAVDDPRIGNDCAPRRMPALLWSADPVELLLQAERTIIRFEALDTVRTVFMNGAPPPTDHPHTELGYSVGRWEGDILIIETTHLLGGVIVNDIGQPISPDTRLTERYWREPGANDLQVEILVDDPVNYVETLRLRRLWASAPSEEILPWGCFSLDPSEEETDVDDLARLLEAL